MEGIVLNRYFDAIGNALENMSKQLEDAIAKLVNVEQQLETAKIEVEKSFPQEQELNDKLARLAELNSLLDMDEKGEDAVDLDEDALKPEPEKVSQERPDEAVEQPYDIGEDYTEPEVAAADIGEEPEPQEDVKADIIEKQVEKPAERTERPSLIERLNEKKGIVASMDRNAPNPQKKREEVIA